jgi:hypothetical protein
VPGGDGVDGEQGVWVAPVAVSICLRLVMVWFGILFRNSIDRDGFELTAGIVPVGLRVGLRVVLWFSEPVRSFSVRLDQQVQVLLIFADPLAPIFLV